MASWLLLAVFVPMLLLSSLHIHNSSVLAEESCSECVQHNCHGHLGQQTLSLDNCLLCQFLTLPMAVAACLAAVTLFTTIVRLTHAQCREHICKQALGVTVTRGPPAYPFLH